MEHNQLELFRQAVTACNVRNSVIFRDGSNLFQSDNGLRMRLYENYDYRFLQNILQTHVSEGHMIRYEDSFGMYYIFVHVSPRFLREHESSHLVIGPYLDSGMEKERIAQIMEQCSIPQSLLEDITLLYHSTPVLPNMESFEDLILKLAQGLFQTDYRITHIPDKNDIHIEKSPMLLKLREKPQISVSTIEERYEVENQMLAALSKGKERETHELYQKFQTYQLRIRANNALQDKKHGVIILNTLFRKAVESGGVHPLHIDDLSGKFAVLINEAGTIRELDHLSVDMIHKYCLLVKNYSMLGYSKVIKEVVSYIDFHYAEDLNLSFFAEMFHISRNYLSGLYKKETGMTLTDYIHQVRSRRAITLINSSSLSITTIAVSCGYNDINYFTRMFKKIYGVSPTQYRLSVTDKHRR